MSLPVRWLAGAIVMVASSGCAVRGPAAEGAGASSTTAPAEAAGPRVRRIDVSPQMELDDVCTPAGPERCFDARDDNCNGLVDEGCGLETGLVQFVIAWRDAEADVDLEVVEPGGEAAEVGRENDAGFIKDRDCPGESADCHGQNYENVVLVPGKDPPRGTYRVRVRLESLGQEEPPLEVQLGARVGPRSYAATVALARVDDVAEALFRL